MRSDGPQRLDINDSQRERLKQAGLPMDRPGLFAEYPKMLYRPGQLTAHSILGDVDGELKIDGKYRAETMVVEDEDEELAALEDGWHTTLDPEAQETADAKRRANAEAMAGKDAEIEALKAQLAEAQKPRIGRPPKDTGADLSPTPAG